MLATICSIGWIALIVLHIAADFYLRNFRIDAEDNPLARKHITQVRVLVRVLDTIIILLTLGIALMTFAEVRPVWGQPLRLGRRCRCAFSSRSYNWTRRATAQYRQRAALSRLHRPHRADS